MKTITTSLGYPLQQTEEGWEINLTELKIFTGLSVLAKIIGEHILDEIGHSPGDVSFSYRLNSNINPELIEMKFFFIQVYARAGVLQENLSSRNIFIDQLVKVFGSLQQTKWRNELCSVPDSDGCNAAPNQGERALIFSFRHENEYGKETGNRFILEKTSTAARADSFFLRLTIERLEKKTIDLSTIPHVVVDDLTTRFYISGSTKMARSVRDNILNACNKGFDFYSEENRIYNRLFEQLEITSLGRLELVNFSWDETFSDRIRKEPSQYGLTAFKKIFLSLEADSICRILHNGGMVKVWMSSDFFCLYLSQLGRALNITINMPRKTFHMNDYLKRMPILSSLAQQDGHRIDLSGVKIFLIHHITSEIIGFIEALKRLGADSLDVMFVKYSGVIPPAYLDTLLENDPEYLFMAGLEKNTDGKATDFYTIADYFSDTSGLYQLNRFLKEKKLSYLDAMKLVSMHLFLKCGIAAKKENKKVIIIEDGGYLAPFLNEKEFLEESTEKILLRFGIVTETSALPFCQWLQDILIGSIEHTKNGYDRLYSLAEKKGDIAFPIYSIAVSNLKTVEESQEVAHSILSAIESILHEIGLVLSRRNIIVLGAEGNIGKVLCRLLKAGRLHAQNQTLTRVDVSYTEVQRGRYSSLEEIPDKELLQKDLFIGVIGKSILKKRQIEKIVLYGKQPDLFFASGSTKTIEFEDLSSWLSILSELDSTVIEGIPVEIECHRIYDPQSGFDQGRKATIRFQRNDEVVTKQLFLLADLSPINFLYYGVPTEIMDAVLAQLLKVSLGMKRQYDNRRLPLPGLYAVDHQINEWGDQI